MIDCNLSDYIRRKYGRKFGKSFVEIPYRLLILNTRPLPSATDVFRINYTLDYQSASSSRGCEDIGKSAVFYWLCNKFLFSEIIYLSLLYKIIRQFSFDLNLKAFTL